jgi:hypothetical protein
MPCVTGQLLSVPVRLPARKPLLEKEVALCQQQDPQPFAVDVVMNLTRHGLWPLDVGSRSLFYNYLRWS